MAADQVSEDLLNERKYRADLEMPLRSTLSCAKIRDTALPATTRLLSRATGNPSRPRFRSKKRMTTPQEIAAMIGFLLSAGAAHITAQHIFVDGDYVHLDRELT